MLAQLRCSQGLTWRLTQENWRFLPRRRLWRGAQARVLAEAGQSLDRVIPRRVRGQSGSPLRLEGKLLRDQALRQGDGRCEGSIERCYSGRAPGYGSPPPPSQQAQVNIKGPGKAELVNTQAGYILVLADIEAAGNSTSITVMGNKAAPLSRSE